jgi:hypothetical protein
MEDSLRNPRYSLAAGQSSNPKLHRLRTTSTAFETRLDQLIGPSLRLLAVLLAVDRIESAIDQAIDGYDPDRRVWGCISAADFLMVVQDVTTWALSNFECFAARPEAENLPNGVRSAAGFYSDDQFGREQPSMNRPAAPIGA